MKRAAGLVLVLAVVIMIITTPLAYSSPLGNSVRYLSGAAKYADNTRDTALVLMATLSLFDKTENGSSLKSTASELIDRLTSSQNPDGGWGYYEGEISSPLDTGFALAALGKAYPISRKYKMSSYLSIIHAISGGVRYLRNSFDGNGWGFVAGTKADPYPTAVALWGLGVNGHTVREEIVRNAVEYLEKTNVTTPKMVALRLIAYRYVGFTGGNYLVGIAYGMLEEDLTPSERAMLTYALSLYPENLNSELGRSLSILEKMGAHNGTFYLREYTFPSQGIETIVPTAYAVMAFAEMMGVGMGSRYPTTGELCNRVISLQNPDGGWGYEKGGNSTSRATFYVLEGLSVCKPLPEAAIQKAVAWARERLNSTMEESIRRGMLTSDFYYTAMILAKYSNMSTDEKEKLVEFVNSFRYPDGNWVGVFSIPQPLQTAMGIQLLKALGEDNFTGSAEWLLSLTNTGWGIVINYRLGVMVAPDVGTTILVLNALSGTVGEKELRPHLNWLLSQRLENGFWSNIKDEKTAYPRIDNTVEALELLWRYHYKLDYIGMGEKLLERVEKSESPVDIALTLRFISDINFVPYTTIPDVVRKLSMGTWYVHYTSGYSAGAERMSKTIEELGGTPIVVRDELDNVTKGNHVIITDLGNVNISRYNPYVKVEISGNIVTIDGVKYSRDSIVLLIPGRTQDGYVLIVLASRKVVESLETILAPTMLEYIRGKYLVFRIEDANGNGVIEPTEIKVVKEG